MFEEKLLRLRLPLVLENLGARALVIQNLRLIFLHEDGSMLDFKWSQTFTTLKPISQEVKELPAIFVIAGRTASQFFFEFKPILPIFEIEPIEYRLRIEAKLTNHNRWKKITEIKFRAQNIPKGAKGNLSYSNAPIMHNKEEEKRNQLLRAEIRSNYLDL